MLEILQPDDGPHVGPKHVVVGTLILIIEVNIVVFDCAYSTRNSLPYCSNVEYREQDQFLEMGGNVMLPY